MSAMRHLRKQSLSVSLPDVSCDVGSSHDFLPMPPISSSPSRAAATNYNIEDDRWEDKMDRVTGSVFFIDAQSGGPHNFLDSGFSRPRSSSSCSSISSMTSDLPYAPSPTASVRSESFSERPSRLQLQRPSDPAPLDGHQILTPEPEEGVHVPNTAILSSKKTSSLKKIKRVFKRKKLVGSGSLSDLSEMAARHLHSLPSFSENDNPDNPFSSTHPMTPPITATQYGSHGLPLPPSYTYSPMSRRAHRGSSIIEVSLDISQFGLGADSTPCSMDRLGIVPSRLAKGRFGSTFSLRYPKGSPSPDVTQSVLIRGVVPGSPAAVGQKFFSGDTIMSVDGQSVGLDSIDTILEGLSGKVVFEVKKGYQRQRSRFSQFPTPGGLVRLVSGMKDAVRSHSHPSHHHSCLLLYLTLDTEEEDPSGKDILYQWPKSGLEEESTLDLLMQLRGLFLTLADLLGEMTGAKSFCSTITVEGSLVHLSYVKYGHELLLLALPATLGSPYQVKLLVEKVSSTIELLYGTVHNAFTSPSTHWSLDHLLALFFNSVTTPPQGGTLDSSPHVLSALQQLTLPANLKAQISVSLNGLDAADHSDRQEILHTRRPFILLGSCLFSKGALACSHLGDSDLKDVCQLCVAYRLPELTATESINQIVIWKQVYLSRLKSDSVGAPKPLLARGSHFVLIIGLDHLFVVMLMEASTPFELHSPPTVDAVYVDRARSLIMELRQLLSDYEENNQPSAPLPALNSVDIVLASKFTRRASLSVALPPTTPLRRKASEPVIPSSPVLSSIKVNIVNESSDSDDPSSTKFSPTTHRRTQSLLSLTKPKKKSSLNQLSVPGRERRAATLKGAVPRAPYQLTSGMDNLLFHYLHLSLGRGVILCPAHTTPPGPVQTELLHTFRETCLTLHESLWGRVEEGVCGVESESDSDGWDSDEEVEKSSASPFAPRLSSVIERGVLMQCGIYHPERHKTTPTLNYWVVGRLFEEHGTKTELYVCYQENMSQDCVEMAYRLLFGWTG